ncbi:MAG: transposase [Gammaproteobacteria bacterium]|nr:transposase [Gammaproteobacteria bacterium]
MYLITAVTHNRQPLFHDFDRARVVILALLDSTAKKQADTLAYVVMPDHFHWLMQLGGVSLSRVVQRVKSKSGYEINRLSQCSGKVWQHGFHDHALRKEENIKAVARYIVANPLRAGLVDSIGDYPFWSAAWL